jgi:rRNA processing protein Gar1
MKKKVLWFILFSAFFMSCMQQQKELTLSSIYVSQMPSKVYYAYDEPLDLTGLEITAYYSNGSEKVVDGWTSLPKPWSKLKSSGTITITITYEGKTTDFPITVVAEGEDVPQETKENSKENPINLTIDKWTNGNIIHPNSGGTGEEWFSFVATASIQNVYIKLSTITYLNAILYDESFNQIGQVLNVQGSGKLEKRSWALKTGGTYYIMVSGHYYGSCNKGSYWIGFTEYPIEPETVITDLSENLWYNGNIIHPNSGGNGEQWFAFTATSDSQYILIKLSTITYLNAILYDESFNQIGKVNVQGSGKLGKSSWALKTGEIYYIMVSGHYYGSCYKGSYWIAFNSNGEEPNQ